MSTFPQSICWRSKAGIGVLAGALLVGAFALPGEPGEKGSEVPPFLKEFGVPDGPRPLRLFLEEFLEAKETPLVTRGVTFFGADGKGVSVSGYFARRDTKETLPAVLMVYNEPAWEKWMQLNTRHLAGIGYAVLTVSVQNRRNEMDDMGMGVMGGMEEFNRISAGEVALVRLFQAVRWLRRQGDVLPNHVGVVGWGWSGGQALALASATGLQACVVCDAVLSKDPGLGVGLRETPVLAVFGSSDEEGISAMRKMLTGQTASRKFHVADTADAGFMGPPESKAYVHDAAEEAWFTIYNFLEKHVEDACPACAVAQTSGAPSAAKPVATIADIMRAVNEPAGLRGVVSKALEQEPANDKQWLRLRANAALIAESGRLLQTQKPAKGAIDHWNKQANAYTAAAESLVGAADRKDYPAAQRGLVMLAEQCAACHEEHR